MNDIRMFLKKNLPSHSMSITYNNNDINYNTYEYKFNNPILGIREKLIFNEFENEENSLELEYKNKTYNDINEIYLILFELVDYKNMEYIDVYLQLKIKNKSNIYIEDIYNDYYDDINKELICIRNLIYSNENKNIKLKFVVYNKTEYYLYYNHEVIKDLDNIITKINQLLI